jgi:hypothetical protein
VEHEAPTDKGVNENLAVLAFIPDRWSVTLLGSTSIVDAEAQAWLQIEADLDPFSCEVLLAEKTRPRSLVIGETRVVN